MRSREKNHVTELLFSVALLCVFLIAGVLVIMTGAGVYRRALRIPGGITICRPLSPIL